MSPANDLSSLFMFSKTYLIVLFIFARVSFISIYFCSDLYDFFPSANFGGFCGHFPLFLGSLGVRLGCLFDVLFIS